jgi:hypothetical protein
MYHIANSICGLHCVHGQGFVGRANAAVLVRLMLSELFHQARAFGGG